MIIKIEFYEIISYVAGIIFINGIKREHKTQAEISLSAYIFPSKTICFKTLFKTFPVAFLGSSSTK